MSERMILSLISMLAGCFLSIGSFILLYTQKFVKDKETGKISVELPFFGRITTNYPALILTFFGAAFILVPVNYCYQNPEMLPIHGKVELQGGPVNDGILIGIIPDKYKTFTNTDGSFRIEVVSDGHSYTGLAYYRSGDRTFTHTSGIDLDKGMKSGEFNALLK